MKKKFKTPLLKCIQLQVSIVFLVKLGSLFIKNIKDVYILEKSYKSKLIFFIWTKYEKDSNGLKKNLQDTIVEMY
jgi:hypothetical protein